MRVSELVERLENAKATYGDIDVQFHPPLAEGYGFDVKTNVHGANFDTPKFGLFMESCGTLFQGYRQDVKNNVK